MTKLIYAFGPGQADGPVGDPAILGHKGAGLATMACLGLPVPPGFILSKKALSICLDHGGQPSPALKKHIRAALNRISAISGRIFGDPAKPFLVALRLESGQLLSGTPASFLNIGLNPQTVEGIAALSGNRDFAYDQYRRFVSTYARRVLAMDAHQFSAIKPPPAQKGALHPSADASRQIIAAYQAAIAQTGQSAIPEDPYDQLWSILATLLTPTHQAQNHKTQDMVQDRAHSPATTAIIQMMVFDRLDAKSARGYAFSRHPQSGRPHPHGMIISSNGSLMDYSPANYSRANHSPADDRLQPLDRPDCLFPQSDSAQSSRKSPPKSLRQSSPWRAAVARQLSKICGQLEQHDQRVQAISFVIENGQLWLLKTENARLSARATIITAVDMAESGLIDQREAIMRVDPALLDRLLHASIASDVRPDIMTSGLPTSPGAASGIAVFSALEARRRGKDTPVILVKEATSPEDVYGMTKANGILTTSGGMSSHAAVIARALGRACVCSARDLRIDSQAKTLRIGATIINQGDTITIDGSTGAVIRGAVRLIDPDISGDFATLLDWADRYRRLKVRANAETREELETAARFGADGVGLCRTEHMFFDHERILTMQEMIMAKDEEGRRAALGKLLPIQRRDFIDLFAQLKNQPVTIRLLDPPLHEFLPRSEEEFTALSERMGIDRQTVRRRATRLAEANPMLGHRGCRLAITYPEIYEMQAQAIFEATLEATHRHGDNVALEIMVPLVSSLREMDFVKVIIDAVARRVFGQANTTIPYKIGPTVELPRAALCAREIAKISDFFSFGTNDLTQTVLGLSRDDAGTFIPTYREYAVFDADPFVTLDEKGVGTLIAQATQAGRQEQPGMIIGICGEHGGDPDSIRFCEKIGLDYVSCSPYRVPIARLAAAQSALQDSA